MGIVKNLAALIKVKTIVTMVVVYVFAALSLRGDITPDNVMIVVTGVTAFYFGTQHGSSSSESHEPSASENGENKSREAASLSVSRQVEAGTQTDNLNV